MSVVTTLAWLSHRLTYKSIEDSATPIQPVNPQEFGQCANHADEAIGEQLSLTTERSDRNYHQPAGGAQPLTQREKSTPPSPTVSG